MIQWIVENRQWLFDGGGLAIIAGLLVVIRWGYSRWRESRSTEAATDSKVARARVASTTLTGRLPGFVLRLFLKPGDVGGRIRIALRDDAPGYMSLGNSIPQIDLYFQITNLSPLDLVLDRMLVDVWFGQPTFSVVLLHRYAVPAGEITQGLHVRQMLSDAQKKQIEGGGLLYIYITAYFESKLGRFFVQRSIERQKL